MPLPRRSITGVATPGIAAQYGDVTAMGLFKKRSTDPAELDQLRSEIASMAARLDAADADKTQLQHRVQHLATKVEQPPPAPAAPPPPAVDPAELDVLRARIQRLNDRIEQLPQQPDAPPIDPATIRTLEVRVEGISAQLADALDAGSSAPGPWSTPPTSKRSAPGSSNSKPGSMPEPGSRTAAPAGAAIARHDRARRAPSADRTTRCPHRIGRRPHHLDLDRARQPADRAAGEVDAVASEQAKAADQPPVVAQDIDVDAVVDELRDTQIRLANEQARYQIAFRQELADLAERLRRP
jgi:hypothetical protein